MALALFIFSGMSIEQGVEHFLCQRPQQSIIQTPLWEANSIPIIILIEFASSGLLVGFINIATNSRQRCSIRSP